MPDSDTHGGVSADVAGGLSPVDALRATGAALSDCDLTLAERIAVAAVILAADREDGRAWLSYGAIRAEYGIGLGQVASALRAEIPATPDSDRRPAGRAIGRHVAICGHGRRGATRYTVIGHLAGAGDGRDRYHGGSGQKAGTATEAVAVDDAHRYRGGSSTTTATDRDHYHHGSHSGPCFGPCSHPTHGPRRIGGGDGGGAGAPPEAGRTGPAGRIAEALAAAGIADPGTRDRLGTAGAAVGLTADGVGRVVAEVRRGGGGPGAVVRRIEAEIPRLHALTEAQAQQDARREAERAAERIERDRIARDAADRDAAYTASIADLSADEIGALVAAAIAAERSPTRRTAWRRDGLACAGLRHRVGELALAARNGDGGGTADALAVACWADDGGAT